jgi:hypothetical protein
MSDTTMCEVIMSLFALNGYYPLPSEVLFCTKTTSFNEIENFILRARYSS